MSDVQTNAPLDIEDAILAQWEDADKQLSEDTTEATPQDDQEETTDIQEVDEDTEEDLEDESQENGLEEDEETETDDDETDAEDEEEDDADRPTLDDEAEVEVLVDGDARKVPVSELKRLYGQEAALTRKSQETAKQRKDAEAAMEKSHVVFQKMLEKAQERYKPYAEVDMLVASRSMATEDFAQLRKEAQEAHDNLRFLSEEADAFYGSIKEQQSAAQQEAAKQCVKTLQENIPEWSNQLYNDIRGYAISQGLPEEQVNTYVDPTVITLINKARLYDQGKQVATTKKKASTTKKVLRSKRSPDPQASKKAQAEKARQQMIKNGGRDLDDITAAILQRWEA